MHPARLFFFQAYNDNVSLISLDRIGNRRWIMSDSARKTSQKHFKYRDREGGKEKGGGGGVQCVF